MKLTEQDLQFLKSNAIATYTGLPASARLPGSSRELNEDERRAYAYLDASMRCLNRLSGGALDQVFSDLNLRTVVITNGHEILDAETEGLVPLRINRT